MSIFAKIYNKLTLNRMGDNHQAANFGCSMGVVVDTDDPLQQGRLRIYCPDLNDDPKKVQHLPWAVYVSPFGGSIRNASHTKGHDPDNATTTGTTQYGFWGIPEKGANVLVTCVNGDPRRRVWLGCIYEHQEVGGLFGGIYDWGDEVDGPFCAPTPQFPNERHKMEPLYSNQGKAFQEKRDSREWKTRAVDYSGMVNVDQGNYGTHSQLSSGEKDSWVREKLGAMGYDWTSFKNLGAHLASKVFGFMSPGLHSISFDDRPFSSRIRLRTTAGHQIIMDDTNERIYVSTYEGNSWVELDTNGNIDVYSDRRISFRAKKDINFSTDETFRVKAAKGIHLYAGDLGDGEGQTPLDSIPADGQIRLHSKDDTHIYTEGNFLHKVIGNVDTIVDGNFDFLSKSGINMESGVDGFHILTPTHKILLDSNFLVKTNLMRLEADNKMQLSGGGENIEIVSGKITLDAPSVAFNDFGTTVGTMISGINTALACCPAPVLTPVDQTVTSESIPSFTFTPDLAEIAPWTNRVPDHEPWPRVLKQDSDDTVNEKNDGYKNNVDWINQFDDETDEGAEQIGVIEGDEEIDRGMFWRR